ncbi:MAG: type II toxin-antitoxin system VapC family toxin [Deltaproteobacteria bacterium]|nr:type II toxin-antitoxin system VapC family toxin [Deltaproteobacteria bacterium]
MKALDTNVLIRFLVDDPDDREAARQRPLAVRALSERVFLPVTVLLEAEWVMRGFYEVHRAEIARALRGVCALDNVTVDSRDAVLTALDALQSGLDFADALHMALSEGCQALQTFDRGFAKKSARLNGGPKVELLR